MDDRLSHALAAEPIWCPKQHAIELPLRRIVEQGGELFPLLPTLPTALVIDVLPTDCMPGVACPVPQLSELILRVLAFVVGRDSRINRDAHGMAPIEEKGSPILDGRSPRQIGLREPWFGPASHGSAPARPGSRWARPD